MWFSPGILISTTNKTDGHDIIFESGVKHLNPNLMNYPLVSFWVLTFENSWPVTAVANVNF
jgi:hypothetical protein